MRLLVTGGCGFVGSVLVDELASLPFVSQVFTVDNLIRSGAEQNRRQLTSGKVHFLHGDIRSIADVDTLPAVDFVIDCAALPSVLGGTPGQVSSRQVVEHNLVGTINLLEYCRKQRAGIVLISTSRVYSLLDLQRIPLTVQNKGYEPAALPANQLLPESYSRRGVLETFPTTAPVSLYGSTKFASEQLALEYAHAFDFPVWINRCGVLAGAGQFARADQGIFAFWIHSWQSRSPLKYIGYGGEGHQVRDCLHPRDLAKLVSLQIVEPKPETKPRIVNVSGGQTSAVSLAQTSDWCHQRFGWPATITSDLTQRSFDCPWIVLDHSLATTSWEWKPSLSTWQIFEEIADFAEKHPTWLQTSQSS